MDENMTPNTEESNQENTLSNQTTPPVQTVEPVYTQEAQSQTTQTIVQETTELPKKGLAIAGMVCGIVSLVLLCFVPIAAIVAVAGLVLSIVALVKKQHKGFSIAGLVTSILGLLAAIVLGMLMISGVALMQTPEFKQEMKNQLEKEFNEESPNLSDDDEKAIRDLLDELEDEI